MVDCKKELIRTVPLYKVVGAAIADTYEDFNRVNHLYSHWAVRGLRQLERQVLHTGKKEAILTVNKSTNTATLPIDCDEVIWVYAMIGGKKVPLRLRDDLIEYNTEELECEDKCEKCNQNRSICEDLTITEETVIVQIDGNNYEQTIIKKLYPDGRYFLETRVPLFDVESQSVVYTTTKQFITSLDLKPCGCIDDSEENIEKIKCCCYEAYCTHYAPCDKTCNNDLGGFKVLEKSGLIQFDGKGRFTKVYVPYHGFLPKKNGQYHVPEVAFETLVEWVKFMRIDGKGNVTNSDKRWRYDRYRSVREDMMKEKGRVSLDMILELVGRTPKFDYSALPYDTCGELDSAVVSSMSSSSSSSSSNSSSSSSSNGDCSVTTGAQPPCSTCPPGDATFVPFGLAVIAGIANGPTPDTHIYQNDIFKDAIGINMIVVNNTPETEKALQFTIDTVTGTLSRFQADGITPNNFQSGDVLIVPTFFKLI